MKLLNKLSERCNSTDALMAHWSQDEQRATLAEMRRWKRSNFAFGLVFLAIGLAAQGMPAARWVLFFAAAQGILYIVTCYVYRIFELRQLVGPLAWIQRYPFDLIKVSR